MLGYVGKCNIRLGEIKLGYFDKCFASLGVVSLQYCKHVLYNVRFCSVLFGYVMLC